MKNENLLLDHAFLLVVFKCQGPCLHVKFQISLTELSELVLPLEDPNYSLTFSLFFFKLLHQEIDIKIVIFSNL